MKYLELEADSVIELPRYGTLPATHHVFDERSIEAINTALATARPLLVRGEPGSGKSQLARAAAADLGRAYLPFTLDARTEARDLKYTVDTVARLADAQILAHLTLKKGEGAKERLSPARYTAPGPLWWVFDWESALRQSERGGGSKPWTPKNWNISDGAVLLIDEIDKADTAVPNGLLEALGQGEFRAPGREDPVAWSEGGAAPLVVITTNEERALPDAFVRRCLVLHLGWPKDEEDFVQALIARGVAHHESSELAPKILELAARMVWEDRSAMVHRGVCPPGGAEYLDLLRAVAVRWPGNTEDQKEALGRIRDFALEKHPKEPLW